MPSNKEGYMEEYYKQHKSKWFEVIECECGKRLIRCNLSHHTKSKKHQTYINASKIIDFTQSST